MTELFSANLRDELFLQSRLSVPAGRPETVERPRVEAALDEILRHPVTLVAAPTGFGKTTLISAWARRQALPLAWVSLDDEIVDPQRFWAHVAQALELAAPGSGAAALRELDTAAVAALPRVGSLLAHGLAGLAAPLVLVIDDLHLVQEPAIIQQLAVLGDHGPPACHIVLLSRTDPPLPLARWRAKGRLLELRADELRFTEAETDTLLRQRLGRALAAADVAAITARTEGWAAGLHLAALMLRGQPDQSAVIAGLSGSHRFVIDYLVEEVLSREPPAVQSFLAETAWLERLSGPLCDAVTGQSDGQTRLEALELQGLFLIPLDAERRWYRYHYLFAECVRAWSRRRGLDTAPIHRRAAAWWQGQGRAREAIGAWLAAEAYPEALPLLAALVPELVRRGEMGTVSRWLDPAPQRELIAYPELAIAYAWVLAFTHRFEATERILTMLADPAAPAPPAAPVQEEMALLQALIGALRHGQLPVGLPERAGFQRILTAYPFLSALAAFLGVEQLAPAPPDFVGAGPQQDSAQRVQAVFGRGRQLFERGQLRAAHALLADALEQEATHEIPPVTAMLYVVFAGVLLAQSRLAEAIVAAERAMELAAQLNNRHVDPMALSIKLHALHGLGRADDAAAVSAALGERRRDPRIVLWLHLTALAEQLRHGLIRGDAQAAAAWEAELIELLAPVAELPPFLHMTIELLRLRAAWDLRGADVRPQLGAAVSTCAAQGWAGLQVEALLLSARVADGLGDLETARDAVEAALALAAPEGALRGVLDAGPELQRLLALARPAAGPPELAPFVAAVRAGLGTAAAPQPAQASPAGHAAALAEPLSEREREVLRLLADGLSNRELAARLVVAEGTIKTHLMNIYGKLGVGSRTQAVARARTLGLV